MYAIYTKVLVRCSSGFGPFAVFLHLLHMQKHRYLRTGATLALKMVAPACPAAAGTLGRAIRACFGAAGALKMATLACPGAASALEKAALARCSAASALKIAALARSGAPMRPKQRFWPALVLPVRPKSLFELASVPPVHSESLFERAVQDHYSKVLVSVALCSESLHSALLCYVRGYARVHISIYL